MGTPAFANVTITCKNKKTVQNICDWIYAANHGELKDEKLFGDYSIDVQDYNDEILDIKIDSGRVQNLEWQIKNLSDFCETQKCVTEFMSNAWMQMDSLSWDR